MTNKNSSSKSSPGVSGRLLSLDVYRGMTIAFMILVNTPGTWSNVFAPLRHASWHGCTPTDLVFPSFLFIAGVAMWFSLKKYNFEFSGPSLFRILRRVALIFAAGLFLNIFPYFDRDYSTLRIMGVLQRIALAYGFGAVIVLIIRKNYIWVATAIILLGYWALMHFFGGADPYSLEGNLAVKVDRFLLGENHLYKGFGIPFDPEGLVSTIPAIGTVLIGFMTGNMISGFGKSWKTVGYLLVIGTALVTAGYFWGKVFPINKPIWTSSYVLYAGGIGMILLALLYMIIDLIEVRTWKSISILALLGVAVTALGLIWNKLDSTNTTHAFNAKLVIIIGLLIIVFIILLKLNFFHSFGLNPMTTYLLAGIFTKTMLAIKIGEVTLYKWIFTHVCSPLFDKQELASLMFALMMVFFVWIFGYILYRKKIIIKF